MSRCIECESNNECHEWCGRSKSDLQDDIDLYFDRWEKSETRVKELEEQLKKEKDQ